MRAMVWTAYGAPEVLHLREVPTPTPADHEVLIKIHAATVTAGDCEARRFDFPLWVGVPLRCYLGLRTPRIPILGQELAGEIEAVGTAVTRFTPGDPVVAATGLHFGAYAQYVCLPQTYPIVLKPATMTYAEAATIPTGGLNAVHFLRKAKLQAGQRVLINGAGGSIGTYAVQIARACGADVTAVDRSDKLDLLRALGADQVIDYTQESLAASGATYDAIVDVVGTSSFAHSVRSLKPHGRYVLGNPRLSGMTRGLWTSLTSDKRVIVAMAPYRTADLKFLIELMEAGKVKAVIDRALSVGPVARGAPLRGSRSQTRQRGHHRGPLATCSIAQFRYW